MAPPRAKLAALILQLAVAMRHRAGSQVGVRLRRGGDVGPATAAAGSLAEVAATAMGEAATTRGGAGEWPVPTLQRRLMTGALLLPLAKVSGLAGPVGVPAARAQLEGVGAPFVPEVISASWLLDAVDAPPITTPNPDSLATKEAGTAGDHLLVTRLHVGVDEEDLPTVSATLESGGEDHIRMAPAIVDRLIFDDNAIRAKHQHMPGPITFDEYEADLAVDPHEQVAIRIMDTEDERTRRELNIHSALTDLFRKRALVGVFAAWEVDVYKKSTYFLMPAADGSLRDDLRSGELLDANQVFQMAVDVLRGLSCLEEAGIVHGRMGVAESIVRKRGRWFVSDLSGSCSCEGAYGVARCARRRKESDAWSFFGLVRNLLRKASGKETFRWQFLAVVAAWEGQRDLRANEALQSLYRLGLANGLQVRGAKAASPPAALFRTPSYSQQHPGQLEAPKPREDGQPLYPELYEKYVKEWVEDTEAPDAH